MSALARGAGSGAVLGFALLLLVQQLGDLVVLDPTTLLEDVVLAVVAGGILGAVIGGSLGRRVRRRAEARAGRAGPTTRDTPS